MLAKYKVCPVAVQVLPSPCLGWSFKIIPSRGRAEAYSINGDINFRNPINGTSCVATAVARTTWPQQVAAAIPPKVHNYRMPRKVSFKTIISFQNYPPVAQSDSPDPRDKRNMYQNVSNMRYLGGSKS